MKTRSEKFFRFALLFLHGKICMARHDLACLMLLSTTIWYSETNDNDFSLGILRYAGSGWHIKLRSLLSQLYV